jgi:hypothetical protein
MRVSRRAGMRRSVHAVVLVAALAAQPVATVRSAWADEPPPSGSGTSMVRTANKAFGLLFMVFKLAEFLGGLDLPPQGGPPDPQWGWHPGPLPDYAPPAWETS